MEEYYQRGTTACTSMHDDEHKPARVTQRHTPTELLGSQSRTLDRFGMVR
jgi:hypothetical protein